MTFREQLDLAATANNVNPRHAIVAARYTITAVMLEIAALDVPDPSRFRLCALNRLRDLGKELEMP